MEKVKLSAVNLLSVDSRKKAANYHKISIRRNSRELRFAIAIATILRTNL